MTNEVNRIAELLLDAWKKADPKSSVALHPTSYVSTFADMATAIIEDRNTRPAAPVEGWEVVGIQHLRSVDGKWHYGEAEYITQDERELVTRSQAEAVIAAKDAEWEVAAKLGSEVNRNLASRVNALEADNAAKDAARTKEEADHTRSLEERDRYHDVADKLAQAIADRYQADIGEHSNINDPWQNALNLIEADNTALTARVEELENERDNWKANHDEMVRQNAVLRQRPDLPVDRIPAIEAYKVKLTSEKAKFEELDNCHERTIDLCNQKSEQIEKLLSEVFHDPALGITWKQICEQFDKECQHHQRRAEISEDRVKELEDYAREATKAITGLSGGGSENFSNPIGDLYPADLPFCLDRIRERYVSKVELKRLETQLADAENAARSAHDTLIEINPSNYNHDDVCQMNDASIEAIFLLADVLGETHGKTAEWWKLRRAALEDKP